MTPARAPKRKPRAARRPLEHTSAFAAQRRLGCAIVTVSDTRRGADDRSGARAQALLEHAGFAVLTRAWVKDDAGAIRRALRAAIRRREVDAVLLTGGTGMGPRDVTPEAVAAVLERELPGFGERFRARSEAQVGTAAWFSRAGAGVAAGRLVVWLPGSTAAVELALEQLLIPELVHAVRTLGRFQPGE